jgi:predicted ABC-type ATPase
MRSQKGRRIIIIAGPNGAGKTTFAKEFLPNEADCRIFVNADLIAAGLAPFDPDRVAIKAGRLMLEEIFEHVRRRDSFAFETTLSGRMYARHILEWREQGFMVKLFFLRLASPELAIARVCQRVKAGGHNVPEETIRRRFASGLRNFEEMYKPIVDEWALYDNSSSTPILVEEGDTMSSEKPDSTKSENKRDPDFINAEIALKRAALKARELARQAGIGVVVLQDGKIIEERTDQGD